jgi:hypothetical protein
MYVEFDIMLYKEGNENKERRINAIETIFSTWKNSKYLSNTKNLEVLNELLEYMKITIVKFLER